MPGSTCGQSPMPSANSASIQVINPGWCTTIQDLGRQGYQHCGVSVCGAMDRTSLIIANRLVDNADTDATLEITLVAPELLFEDAAVIAITGADLSPAIDGCGVPMWTALAIHAGNRLTFGRRRTGARAYLAAAGGLEAPLVWGSRATHLSSATGGFDGRALMAGDRLQTGSRRTRPRIGTTLAQSSRPVYIDRPTLRIIAGPQHVSAEALSILTTTSYRLTSQSDRMGYRLEGRRIPHDSTLGSGISDGTAMGALQIPPDGSPILLMADRPTTGGYPKIATVISADLPQAGQLRPGDAVEFRMATLPEAEAALTNQWRRIHEVLPGRE